MSAETNEYLAPYEVEFLSWDGVPAYTFVLGMLVEMRKTGQTLTKVYDEAMGVGHTADHRPAYTAAYHFLRANAAFFNIQIEED